jgi:hypothetical protein
MGSLNGPNFHIQTNSHKGESCMYQLRTASQVEEQYREIQGDLSGKSLVIIPREYPDREARIAKVHEFLAPYPDYALVEIVGGAEPEDWTEGCVFDKSWVLRNPDYYADTMRPWTIFGLTPQQCTAFAPNINRWHEPIGELFIVSCNKFSMEDSLLEEVNRVLKESGCVAGFEELAVTWMFEDFMKVFPCIDVVYYRTHLPEGPTNRPRIRYGQDCLTYYLKEGYTFEDFLRMVSEFAFWPVNEVQLMGLTGQLECLF